MTKRIIHEHESNVASYNRAFPFVIQSAKGSLITDDDGKEYIDFFSGAGANNYGHNPEAPKQALLRYIQSDGINNSLDMATTAKTEFIDAFYEIILKPRNYDYRLQFTGPTGTNAVEAALKLVRKNTSRKGIVSFTRGFHGVSLGSLAATSNTYFREAAGVELHDVSFIDYDSGELADSLAKLEHQFADIIQGDGLPAGVIVETTQGEGGVNSARPEWLQTLRSLTEQHGVLLIIDDIQAGCGRSGDFFSFEKAGIVPDVVTLSKSISGYGSPMSLVLIRPEYDVWRPAEHNGTFRGNNHAFVTAKAALEEYWKTDQLAVSVEHKAAIIRSALEKMASEHPKLGLYVKGRGFLQGISFANPSTAADVGKTAFAHGLIVERAGTEDEVVKLMPALTIDEATLLKGLDILAASITQVAATAN